MRSMFRTVFVAMLAVLALSTVAASAAQASEEAPFFKVAGTRLAAGASKEVKATTKTLAPFTIDLENGTVQCSAGFSSGSKLLGSSVGEPGTGEVTLTYSGCRMLGNDPECKVEVKSLEPLRATLVDLEKKAKGPIAVELRDVKGSKSFIEIKGSKGCVPGEFVEKLGGTAVAEVLSGGNTTQEDGSLVEVGKEPAEAKVVELYFPQIPIRHVWSEKGGVGSEEEVEIVEGFAGAELGPSDFRLELGGEPLWGVFQ